MGDALSPPIGGSGQVPTRSFRRASSSPRAHLRALLRHPRAWLGTLSRALRLTPGTPRGTLWQLFYFAEAVVLWRELVRREIRHIHAHFADVASDVALLAVDIGNRIDGGGWTWSLAFHGPRSSTGCVSTVSRRRSRTPRS